MSSYFPLSSSAFPLPSIVLMTLWYLAIVSSTNFYFSNIFFCSFPHSFDLKWLRSWCNSYIFYRHSYLSMQSLIIAFSSSPICKTYYSLFQIISDSFKFNFSHISPATITSLLNQAYSISHSCRLVSDLS